MDLDMLISIYPFSWQAVLTALVCGFMVGLERQLRGKPVGMRTASLITLGTYIFVAASMALANTASDPSRIIGQVVTGVGFLEAGVMLTKDGMVLGVTSAATIWVLAAISVCVAVFSPWVAIKFAGIVIVILYGVDALENYSSALTRGVHSKYYRWRGKNEHK